MICFADHILIQASIKRMKWAIWPKSEYEYLALRFKQYSVRSLEFIKQFSILHQGPTIWNSRLNSKTCSQRQWLHSSVGKALHWYREVTGSKPRWSPEFFSGFFTQLHKLRSLRRSFLHFHFISAVHIWFISYIISTQSGIRYQFH